MLILQSTLYLLLPAKGLIIFRIDETEKSVMMTGKSKYFPTLLLQLNLMFFGTQARIQPSVRLSLANINSTMISSEENVQKEMKEIYIYLDSQSRNATQNVVSSSIEEVGYFIENFTSGNTDTSTTSAIEIISSMANAVSVVGPIGRTIGSLFSKILGLFGAGGHMDMGLVVRKSIEDILRNYEESDLRAEARGTARVYRISQAYLNAKNGGAFLSEHEINSLSSNIPIFSGIRFLGILANKITENARTESFDQGKRALAYTNLYVKLATLRSVIFMQMQTLIKASGHSDFTVNAIKRVADAEDNHDKEVLRFLTTPKYSMASLFAQLFPSQEPLLSKFFSKHGLKFQNLRYFNSSVYTFRPQAWTNYYMAAYQQPYGYMYGSTYRKYYYIAPINSEDGLFYITYAYGSPKTYMKMNNDKKGYCITVPGLPGTQGEWKIVQYEDGKIMFSPRKWLNWFVYMKSNKRGTIRGWNGDPGSQGHWLVDGFSESVL